MILCKARHEGHFHCFGSALDVISLILPTVCPCSQVRIHDLKRLNAKAGSSLVALPRLECGILFSTYDMLISCGKETAATKAQAKAKAATAAARIKESTPQDLGHHQFGESELLIIQRKSSCMCACLQDDWTSSCLVCLMQPTLKGQSSLGVSA